MRDKIATPKNITQLIIISLCLYNNIIYRYLHEAVSSCERAYFNRIRFFVVPSKFSRPYVYIDNRCIIYLMISLSILQMRIATQSISFTRILTNHCAWNLRPEETRGHVTYYMYIHISHRETTAASSAIVRLSANAARTS